MKKTLVSIAVVLGVFFGLMAVVPGARYVFWGDETEQVIPFTMHFMRVIKNGEFGWWNWTMSYGGSNIINFFTVLGSPSFWTFLLLPDVKYIPQWIEILTIIRTLLIGCVSYKWLSKLVMSEKARYAGSMIMAFCGWIMFWQPFYYYADAWLYFCILLYTMEELLENRKTWLFPVIVALNVVLYLYTAYMATWLILFYLIVRIQMKYGRGLKSIKEHIGIPVALYFLGLGLSAIIFIPDLYVLLDAGRVSSNIPSLLSDPHNAIVTKEAAWRYFASFFSPVTNDYDCVIFASPYMVDGQFQAVMFLYSFILYPLLVPQLLKVDFKGRRPLFHMLVFLGICGLSPWIYILFNGNINGRWCFYFTVFHVMTIAFLLEHENQLNQKLLWNSCIVVSLILIVLSACALKLNLIPQENRINIYVIVPCLIVLVLCYTLSFIKDRKKLFTLAILAESLLCFSVYTVNMGKITITYGYDGQEYYDSIFDTEITDQIQKNDPGFFRIATDEPTSVNFLLPMAKGYKGSSYYYGIYNASLDNYYDKRITNSWFIFYGPSKFLSQAVFGQKYLITYAGENSFVPYGYTETASYDNNHSAPDIPVTVWKNAVDMGLGYASDTVFSYPASKSLDKSVQDYAMTQGILINDGDNEFVTDSRFTKIAENVSDEVIELGDHEAGTLFADYSNIYPNTFLNYELYKNGNAVAYQHTEEYGFRAVHVDSEVDAIGIYPKNGDFPSASTAADIWFISDHDLDEVYAEMNAMDHFTNVVEDKGNISADITITKDNEIAATSIPYNKGWKVLVDGKSVVYETVNTCMIGFPLEKGTHHVEFRFVPQGLYAGMAVSLFSIVIFILWRRKSFSN